MIATTYHDTLLGCIDRVRSTQWEALNLAADKMAGAMMKGGLVHLFGSGHSHLPVEEAFFRSGGLAPMSPIFDPALMLHEGIEKICLLERTEGYARIALKPYELRAGEVMIIFSVSGKNPVPVDVALECRRLGVFTVAVTALEYSRQTPPMHSCGKHLYEVADLVIDNCVPFGDVLVTDSRLPGIGGVGAGGTITSLYIVNMLQMLVVDRYLNAGMEPPLTVCMNTGEKAAAAHNERSFAAIRDRIRHL